MKFTILLLTLSLPALAQTVNIKDIDAQSSGNTTIRVEKGGEPAHPVWQVQDGEDDIEGDTSGTNAEAKKAWKKACEQWKKDFRADNKENKVISLNCGTATCSGEAGSKVCTSKAKYKIKTQVE